MGSVKVKINSSGMRSVLRSGGVASFLDSQGAKVEAAANSMASPDTMDDPPFERSTKIGLNRARCNVVTRTPHGAYANSKHNVLLKCVRG